MANYDDKTVYVFNDVLNEVQKFRDFPTGKAYLFGQWTSSFNPVVHGIYLERNGSSNFKFESLPTCVEDVKTQLENNFHLNHIGEVVVKGSSYERSQDLSRNVNALGRLILKVFPTSNDLEALLYSERSFRPFYCRIDALRGENPFSLVRVKTNIVEFSREDGRLERSEVGQYGNRERDGRFGGGGFDHREYRKPLANASVHPVPVERPNLAINRPRYEQLRTTPATGHVARMGNNFESGVEEAEIMEEQWYASEKGQKKLKKLQEGVKDIASDCKVEMKRDKVTHNLSFTFDYYRTEWELIFPSHFPSDYLKLKKVGDSYPTTRIFKHKTRDILNEIKDKVKQHSFSWR